MKKYVGLVLAALLLAAALTLASCGASTGSGDSGSGGDMKGMDHEGMKGDKKSGGMKGMGHDGTSSGMAMNDGEYSDRAFIDGMVLHHQGAVEMAQVALKNAEHEEIATLSENIISTQQAEIKELKAIKKSEFGTSSIPMKMSPEQMDGMGMMMDPDKLADQKPFDKAFIEAMIPHHQSAIEMSRTASGQSNNPDIQSLAENIVTAQEKEIEQMQSWRKEWYPKG